MSIEAVTDLFAIGAALVGFWVVFRFPTFGPHSIGSGMLALAGALALLPLSAAVIGTVAGTFGAGVALVGVMLPSLAAVFWAGGCFFRLLAGALR
jgi:hypothetical protein